MKSAHERKQSGGLQINELIDALQNSNESSAGLYCDMFSVITADRDGFYEFWERQWM